MKKILQTQVSQVAIGSTSMIAPLSSESPAFAKSQINHGIRQVNILLFFFQEYLLENFLKQGLAG